MHSICLLCSFSQVTLVTSGTDNDLTSPAYKNPFLRRDKKKPLKSFTIVTSTTTTTTTTTPEPIVSSFKTSDIRDKIKLNRNRSVHAVTLSLKCN